MTEKQQARMRLKIKKIKSKLAADKKRCGGFYDDSGGLRYTLLECYIKLQDYTGGKRYMNWFYKNFPDDAGFPEFLFECSIVLYYSKKLKEAQKKLFETYASNTYVLDQFLGNETIQMTTHEGSNIRSMEYLNHFSYSSENGDLIEFTKWVKEALNSDLFKSSVKELHQIQRALLVEKEYEKRRALLARADALNEKFSC